jgi:oligopeptidase B
MRSPHAAPEQPVPPVAPRKPKTITRHGDRRVDPYFWLRERSNPEVTAYLDAENRYTDAVMQPLEGFRDALYKEFLSRIKETDESVPYRHHGYWYYVREVQGMQYPIYCRRNGSMQAPEEVMLDVNELARGHAYCSVGLIDVSPDAKWLAYTVDFVGYRQYTLHVKNLETGELARETAVRVTSTAWAADNETLFFVQEHEGTKRSYQLHRMRIGAPEHALVYEEADERFDMIVCDTRSEKFVVLGISSKDTSDIRVVDSDQPLAEFRAVLPRREGHEYFIDHRGDEFFIRTNDKGRNFRLVRAPVADPSPKNWRQVVAHRPRVMLEECDLFEKFWVLVERDKGLLRFRFTEFATGKSHYLQFDEEVYAAHSGANLEYDTERFRFIYESFVTPRSWYEYEVFTGNRTLLKRQPVLGEYDPEQYESKALSARAPDGTRVPISIVYRKDQRGEAPNPLLLYGYGAYGFPLDSWFSTSRISLMDRGVIYAIAHIRGGGDLGKTWYDEGKLLRKKSTFTDFIACAEALVKRRYTAPDRLVIQGGSAGGLLMGAVTNMRPDLFKAVVAQVPFLDVLTTMLDPTLPLTIGEYLEWGNPNEPRYYRCIKSYSPYDNLKKRAYPAMFVEASLHDSQVGYWEAAKYVAKVRALKTDDHVLILRTIMEAGHAGASGRYDALKELAFTYSFILDQMGLATA